MRFLGLLLVLLVMFKSTSYATGSWPLVTSEEVQSSRAAPRPDRSQSRSLVNSSTPTIDVEQPDPTKPISSPVSIKVEFHAQDGATIDTSSIRIYYGWLQLDITSRVLEHAQVTADGLSADNADLPSGDHSVTITVTDSKGRTGSRDLDFTVL